jgi:hypothetical protein
MWQHEEGLVIVDLRDDCYRTISAAPHLRAARPLWSESGSPGGVNDLGGGEQPAEASAASTSGSPSAGRGISPFALAGPAMPDGTKSGSGTPPASRSSVVWRPCARLEMCLAQADSTPMAQCSGIVVVERRHAVAGRREP